MARELRFATFNAGLATGVLPDVDERASRLSTPISAMNLDVMCLQEVWESAHWQQVQNQLKPALPHAIRPANQYTDAQLSCDARDLRAAVDCAKSRCGGSLGKRLPECMVQQCRDLVNDVSPACVACLTRDPDRELGSVQRECAGGDDAPSRAGGGGFLYGGSYGLALLSRTPPAEQNFLMLESTQIARGVIHARYEPPGYGPMHVFCTHLSTDLHTSRTRGSWSSEQAEQIRALLAFVTRHSGADAPAVLLGDLNTGPAAGRNTSARWPDHYRTLIDSGFVNPYLARPDPSCTFCSDNPLVGGSRRTGLLIDHALVRGFPGLIEAERALDQRIQIVRDGRRLESTLSDHYGVVISLRRDGA